MLGTIEAKIHKAKNRTRYSMNSALIGIGAYNAKLRKRALQVAKNIGTVEVDHGETGCKTPDAAAYIAKTVAHHGAKKKATKKKGAQEGSRLTRRGRQKSKRRATSRLELFGNNPKNVCSLRAGSKTWMPRRSWRSSWMSRSCFSKIASAAVSFFAGS